MEGNWSVYYKGASVGTCAVTREGLYYRFHCRCWGKLQDICSLCVRIGESQVDLGILVPAEDGFGLDRIVVAKRFPPGVPEFALTFRNEQPEEEFIAVREEEPFSQLTRLEGARMAVQDGQIGVVLK